MAKILLIETSTEVCSVAIGIHGNVVAIAENVETQNHASLLTLQINDCVKAAGILQLADFDAVALSRGPGAYTSLRVGASVAKGICYALDKPLIVVDTLRALTAAVVENLGLGTGDWGLGTGNWELGIRDRELEIGGTASNVQRPTSTLFVPMLDARREELWLAVYDANLQEIAAAQPLILENNSFDNFMLDKAGYERADRVILSGNGMKKMECGGISEKIFFSEIKKCSARYLAQLAEGSFQKREFQDIAYFEPFYMKPPNITTPAKPPF